MPKKKFLEKFLFILQLIYLFKRITYLTLLLKLHIDKIKIDEMPSHY